MTLFYSGLVFLCPVGEVELIGIGMGGGGGLVGGRTKGMEREFWAGGHGGKIPTIYLLLLRRGGGNRAVFYRNRLDLVLFLLFCFCSHRGRRAPNDTITIL